MDTVFLPHSQFQHLIDSIYGQGYYLYGPQERDGAIVFEPLQSVSQLPQGMEDEQTPAAYRLRKTDSNRWFNCVSGPQALKPIIFRTREILWQAKKDSSGRLHFSQESADEKPVAVLGVRACDIAALKLQDLHFMQATFVDAAYARRRKNLLVLAVNCVRSSNSCFCVSTGDGPQVDSSVDIQLTELESGFVLQCGSDVGENVVKRLNLPAASAQQVEQAQSGIRSAAETQQRQLPFISDDINDALLNSAVWDHAMNHCLSCGNCTAVCPSCFCSEELEDYDYEADSSLHYRQWSSCFTMDHSYMHGLNTRGSTRLQYRQWFVHKLVSWKQQYGRSGCVGCGRCITWCPVGIDITELAQEIHRELHA